MAVLSYQNLEIKVNVFDKNRRKFDNISSVPIMWKLSDKAHGNLKLEKGVEYPKAK